VYATLRDGDWSKGDHLAHLVNSPPWESEAKHIYMALPQPCIRHHLRYVVPEIVYSHTLMGAVSGWAMLMCPGNPVIKPVRDP
jgi:hypothetical protein